MLLGGRCVLWRRRLISRWVTILLLIGREHRKKMKSFFSALTIVRTLSSKGEKLKKREVEGVLLDFRCEYDVI